MNPAAMARHGEASEDVALDVLARDIAGGAGRLGLALSPQQVAALAAYVALLAKWNRTYNLTAIREPARMVTHHVLDSLAVLPHLPQHEAVRLLDVGSGGGLPGIPLAIARADWRATLVDPVHKKAAFLAQAAIELGLGNVESHAARVEELRTNVQYDVVISRAFADLATFAALSEPHLAQGGVLVAMKGVHPVEEIAHLPREFTVVATPALTVPGLDAARHLIIMRRAQ